MNRFLLVIILVLAFGFTSVNAQDFSTHQVKKGETIEAIAKRYFVTPSEIYALNPDAKKELKPNTILIIPLSKAKKPKVVTIKELQGFQKHKTRRKETLYSLAKKYNVTEDEIKKYNKFLYADPLRKGDKLQIPIFKITEEIEAEPTKTYIVQPKEGKWRIAYKFGISVKKLEELNPEMGEVLKDGQEIIVPNIEDDEEREVDEKYSYYKVLPKEGFYRLKLKLGLEKDALEALNPGLAESGLKVGMILKIPFNEAVSVESPSRINLTDSIKDFNTKHIAVMLPFRLNRVDFQSKEDTKKSIVKDRYLDTSLDFYSGVLMAIDSLKTLGVSLHVDVYDTKNEIGEVSRIIDDNDFETVDAVIGPLTSNTFEKAASKLRRYNVPVVSPIGLNLKLYDNVFQSRPPTEKLKSTLVNYIKTDTLPSNIIIISDSKHTQVSNDLKRDFNHAKQIHSRKNKKSGDDDFFVTKEDIEEALKPGKNIVFLETKNEGFVSNVTSILASLIKTEDLSTKTEAVEITMATTNMNAAFTADGVSNEHLSKLQFFYAATSKSYNESGNNTFVKTYKKRYYTTPNSAAVKGFDLTMDVVLRIVSSEDLYMSVNNAPLTEYVENKFAYKKKLFGGYYNDTVYLVNYQDLAIVEVKQ
ncbi:PBP1 and LysM peptidoglycan-binding domain-containing protein [Hwangdonia lutea]|uniref:LysM peptidoglycan-binding domain-containing protein n=1 Tax=Hwangdonia lutea TaxID=3075823 RepID=A0AA97EMW0_9FLAO|nr:LysM peptidoglycan-binding domain-containing protein [Hwangdonia sp. SCSIO 19198]WOD44092.1 LysM peptidoglycan-binding domain-containing protein [Hwangdonia sp. SCSIO 19198]